MKHLLPALFPLTLFSCSGSDTRHDATIEDPARTADQRVRSEGFRTAP